MLNNKKYHKIKFSLLYTTARVELIPSVIKRWCESKRESDLEMLVVTDEKYTPLDKYAAVTFLVNDGLKNCVAGWNFAAKYATGEVFIQVSDDLFPPEYWDLNIAKIISMNSEDREDLVLNLLDERMCKSAVYHPVMTKFCYDKLGHLYPADFESMFCDDWYFMYHSKYSKLIQSNEKFWVHKHRTTHESVIIDKVTLEHESPERYISGRKTLDKYIKIHEL